MAIEIDRRIANKTFLTHMVTKGRGSYFAGSGDLIGSITVLLFGGVQPDSDTVISDWSTGTSYYNSYLALFTKVQFLGFNSSYNTSETTTLDTSNSILTVNASATGTATWALGLVGLHGSAQITTITSSIPTTSFWIAPVSDTSGTDIVRLSSTSLTSGSPVDIVDIKFMADGGGID